MQTEIDLKFTDDCATLCLVSQQGKPPTMDTLLLRRLDDVLTELESRRPAAVVVRSASEKFFCVGADLKVVRDMDAENIVPWVLQGHRILNRLEDLPFPVIAEVHGYALGGGLELALACDWIVTSHSARFGQTEGRLGLIPGWGGSHRLVERIGKSAAKRLFACGDLLDGASACNIGLAAFAGDPAEVSAELSRMLAAIRSNSALSITLFKTIVQGHDRPTRDANAAHEAHLSRQCMMSRDTATRIQDFFANRAAKQRPSTSPSKAPQA